MVKLAPLDKEAATQRSASMLDARNKFRTATIKELKKNKPGLSYAGREEEVRGVLQTNFPHFCNKPCFRRLLGIPLIRNYCNLNVIRIAIFHLKVIRIAIFHLKVILRTSIRFT